MKKLLGVALAFYLLAGQALAVTTPASGQFTAQNACEMFQSKKNQSNPGHVLSIPSQVYDIKEVIFSGDQPAWIRVVVDDKVSLRWVDASCGAVTKLDAGVSQPNAANDAGSGKSCSIAGQQDAYVLAISWQAAFCSSRPDKTECKHLKDEPYASKHFTLHGLWPNKNACGINYGSCGGYSASPRDFCQYPLVPGLSESVQEQLAIVMPSVKYGTCLDRHEWWKHGTCTADDSNQYFSLAMSLLDQINKSAFVADYIQSHIGEKVTVKEFTQAFDMAFGEGAHTHIQLSCNRGGMLQEIQMKLPQKIDGSSSLVHLLKNAGTYSDGGQCRSSFLLAPA